MASSIEHLTLTIPITQAAINTADKFSQEQPNSEKARQVYLNTLAVLVVRDYLEMLEISTNLKTSYSWNPVGRLCGNIADLDIPEVGHLECRPVLMNENICYVPPEVWWDRIGYLVVQLNESKREGILLGFASTVSSTELPLNQLQSLEHLLIRLHQQPVTVIQLSQWLNQIFSAGWQSFEEILGTTETNLTFAFRSSNVRVISSENTQQLIEQIYSSQNEEQRKIAAQNLGYLNTPDPEVIAALTHLLYTTTDEETRWSAVESLWILDPENRDAGVKRIKDLGMQLEGHEVGLMVAILSFEPGESSVLLRVYPMANQTYLPSGLQLTARDDMGNIFSEVTSRKADNYIQLKFTGQLGEQFSVKISCGEASIVESFMI
ncbi:DUF1822 family protein [Planktothrix pseudagardhii]|uniref:DUF1822 family protein n=1 Tax=Planktothrix pseudagardhii TaxID=132604 RepID=A0A9W4GBH9_9CYAN|nr:DUF1822 family protein [Planktothrix pseudagardhii]CAD5988649.1 hypothetical protein NO713_05756 [Planktothrix pseudagardhii]